MDITIYPPPDLSCFDFEKSVPKNRPTIEYNDSSWSDVLFPVTIRRVFIPTKPNTDTQFLPGFNPPYKPAVSVKRSRARGSSVTSTEGWISIVGEFHGKEDVYSIAKSNFRIITHKEALEIGILCLWDTFYERLPRDEIRLTGRRGWLSARGTEAVFDVVDKRLERDVYSVSERWTPFVRIKNYYHTQKKPTFSLGFSCSEALSLVLPDTKVELSVSRSGSGGTGYTPLYSFTKEKHTVDAPHDPWNIISSDRISTSLRNSIRPALEVFWGYLNRIYRYYLPERLAFALLCRAFNIRPSRFNNDSPRRSQERLNSFRAIVQPHLESYLRERGSHAYNFLLYIMKISSNWEYEGFDDSRDALMELIGNPIQATEQNQDYFQELIGNWVLQFVELQDSPEFDVEAYLGEFTMLVSP